MRRTQRTWIMVAPWILRLVGRTATVSPGVSSIPRTGPTVRGSRWSKRKLLKPPKARTTPRTWQANTLIRVRLAATVRRSAHRARRKGRRLLAHPCASDRRERRTSGKSWRTPTRVIRCTQVLAQQVGLFRVLFGTYWTSGLADTNTRTSLTACAITGALLHANRWGKGRMMLG
jgi:hypothetical protein